MGSKKVNSKKYGRERGNTDTICDEKLRIPEFARRPGCCSGTGIQESHLLHFQMLPTDRVRYFGVSSRRCDKSDHQITRSTKSRCCVTRMDQYLLDQQDPSGFEQAHTHVANEPFPFKLEWFRDASPHRRPLDMVLLQRCMTNRSVGPELQQNLAWQRVE